MSNIIEFPPEEIRKAIREAKEMYKEYYERQKKPPRVVKKNVEHLKEVETEVKDLTEEEKEKLANLAAAFLLFWSFFKEEEEAEEPWWADVVGVVIGLLLIGFFGWLWFGS